MNVNKVLYGTRSSEPPKAILLKYYEFFIFLIVTINDNDEHRDQSFWKLTVSVD